MSSERPLVCMMFLVDFSMSVTVISGKPLGPLPLADTSSKPKSSDLYLSSRSSWACFRLTRLCKKKRTRAAMTTGTLCRACQKGAYSSKEWLDSRYGDTNDDTGRVAGSGRLLACSCVVSGLASRRGRGSS